MHDTDPLLPLPDPPALLIMSYSEKDTEFLRRTLAPLGIVCRFASGEEEALEALHQKEFAAIIYSIETAGVTSLQTARHIRQIQLSHRTPIIFIAPPTVIDHLLDTLSEDSEFDYLRTPFPPAFLRSKVKIFVSLFIHSQQLKITLHENARDKERIRLLNRTLEQNVKDRTRDLENALRRAEASEQRYRQLAESLPLVVWTTEPNGDASYFNSLFYEYTGVPRDTNLNYAWLRLIHPEDRRLTAAKWRRSLRTGEPFEAECRLRRRSDNAWRHHITRAEALRRADGTIEKWLGIATDVEEKTQTENMLIAANQTLQEARDRAVEASQAKSLFLANMSHELRTPLNVIIGYAEMLHEELTAQKHEFHEDAHKISISGRHLLSLIDDILDMAKIEAGKIKLNLETLNIGQIITELLTSVQGLASQNNNTLTHSLPPQIPPATLDPVKLRQILFNLLSNACKFTENGEITVTGSTETRNQQSWLSLAISDTGIGIPLNEQKNLFREFSQADPTASRRYGGTGLGLALSQRLAHMMGGSITVHSQPGQGSTFTVYLPLHCDQPAPATHQ